jgi:3-hydroxyisobutyrate dehydrogenase-like beta-hydroxyacid dehydrogenase
VITDLDGRSPATVKRAQEIGAVKVSGAELAAQSEMILSIIPPNSAVRTAEFYAGLIQDSTNKPVFIDANAIAPQTTKTIGDIFTSRDLAYGDASIIGAPPKGTNAGPRFYMSGPVGPQAAILREFKLDTRVLSDEIGDASALKMAYAGITKGFQALGTAMIMGAARNGAFETFMDELDASQADLATWLRAQLPRMYAKAYRWDGEMREIAKFLEPEAGSAMMLTGAAELYVHVARDNAEGPQSEIISTLEQFAGANK